MWSVSSNEKNLPKIFHCQKCGSCCTTSGWVYVSEHEIYQIAQHLGINPFDFIRKFTLRENRWLVISNPHFHPHCFLTKDNSCAIYPVRPHYCQTYPFEFKNSQEYEKALKLCPELQRLSHTKNLTALREGMNHHDPAQGYDPK